MTWSTLIIAAVLLVGFWLLIIRVATREVYTRRADIHARLDELDPAVRKLTKLEAEERERLLAELEDLSCR